MRKKKTEKNGFGGAQTSNVKSWYVCNSCIAYFSWLSLIWLKNEFRRDLFYVMNAKAAVYLEISVR